MWESETSALRPVSPHIAHGTRAQFGISITVRSHRPAPGCPSDASSALYEPICASFGARQPTQRARRPSPSSSASYPHDECFEAIARRQNARHTLPVPYLNPSVSAARPVSPGSADDARAQFGNRRTTTVRSGRPAPGCPSHACCALPKLRNGSREARQPTQRARRATPIRHSDDDCSKRSPGARMPVTRLQCPIRTRLRQAGGPSAHAARTTREHSSASHRRFVPSDRTALGPPPEEI